MRSVKKIQVFLLHFAGGNIYSFDFLQKKASRNMEFIPLELPGRGKRMDEEFLANKSEAVQDYTKQIVALRNDEPFIIYGHSMGSTLSLSVARALNTLQDGPAALVVSGSAGPGVKMFEGNENQKRYLMNDTDFKSTLRDMGGVPEEVLQNEELFDFYSPIIRADFKIIENDLNFEENIMLDIPVFALMGSEEKGFSEIENWKNFTNNKCQFKILKGNHFFIHDHPSELAGIIAEVIVNVSSNV